MRESCSDPIVADYGQALCDCRELYVQCGRDCAQQHANLLDRPAGEFIEMMDDLHRGLVVKIYTTVALADHKWARQERVLAQVLLEHAWLQTLNNDQLRVTMQRLAAEADTIGWYSLLRPFAEFAPLRERVAEVESVVVRMANIVAKADGQMSTVEQAILDTIRGELQRHLQPIRLDGDGPPNQLSPAPPKRVLSDQPPRDNAQSIRDIGQDAQKVKTRCELPAQHPGVETTKNPSEQLKELIQQLDGLIGLASVKEEIRTLANFSKAPTTSPPTRLARNQCEFTHGVCGKPRYGKNNGRPACRPNLSRHGHPETGAPCRNRSVGTCGRVRGSNWPQDKSVC